MTLLADPEVISTADLEEMWDVPIPCGGVAALNIPPCGAVADVHLDRTYGHSRRHPPRAADFKCMSCYEKWATDARRKIRANGGLIFCSQCGKAFRTVEEFARYRPLR